MTTARRARDGQGVIVEALGGGQARVDRAQENTVVLTVQTARHTFPSSILLTREAAADLAAELTRESS